MTATEGSSHLSFSWKLRVLKATRPKRTLLAATLSGAAGQV